MYGRGSTTVTVASPRRSFFSRRIAVYRPEEFEAAYYRSTTNPNAA
ncbi:hypothetical protein ACIOHS_37495 [Streptomyces sp. NPDC088253]